jgi:hypothetical protein
MESERNYIMEFTMSEIAQLLGEKDLVIATMHKEMSKLNDRNEHLLKAKDALYNELHDLKLKTGSYPKEVPNTDGIKEVKA